VAGQHRLRLEAIVDGKSTMDREIPGSGQGMYTEKER
jgi:hypothetical protein